MFARRGDVTAAQDLNSRIDYWNRVTHQKHFSHPLRVDLLIQHLKSPLARILDYGCGYGRTLAELSSAGFKNLAGADFSEAMLARAKIEAPDTQLIRNDARGLSFANDCFDAVLMFAVLTCIPDDNEQRRLMSEVQRVLRPGGIIYLSDLLINDDARNRERYEQCFETYGCYGVFELPEGVVVRHHSKEWIEEVTSSFGQLEYDEFTVTTMNGNASAAVQYLGRKVN